LLYQIWLWVNFFLLTHCIYWHILYLTFIVRTYSSLFTHNLLSRDIINKNKN
jgi:hypothetical protein